MKIKNGNGFSAEELQQKAEKGARFVQFSYTVSLILVSFQRTSGIYLVNPGERARKTGMPFTILSFLFGWWGIPSGPKKTFESIRTNWKGGKDVTDEVTATIAGHILFREAQKEKEALKLRKEILEQKEFDPPVDTKGREDLMKAAGQSGNPVHSSFSKN